MKLYKYFFIFFFKSNTFEAPEMGINKLTDRFILLKCTKIQKSTRNVEQL